MYLQQEGFNSNKLLACFLLHLRPVGNDGKFIIFWLTYLTNVVDEQQHIIEFFIYLTSVVPNCLLIGVCRPNVSPDWCVLSQRVP